MNGFSPRATASARQAISVAAAIAAIAATAAAQYCTPDQCDECDLRTCCLPCCHDLPELWVLNTRCVPKCSNLDCGFERITYKRYDAACGRFVRESRESFLTEEASMPTLFYVHGNTLEHRQAMKGFWEVYKKMRCCPGRKRLVCWSWPSQIAYTRPLFRPRKLIEKNLKAKFVYAEYQGYYLAKLVNQMSLSKRVMLSGHSYGAITAAVACHFMGGGTLRGLTLQGGAPVERPNLRATMISGAFDNDSLIPGYRYGQAFVAAEKILVTRNGRDKTLDSWLDVSPRQKPAIGVTGLNANRLGQYCNKLCQITMTTDVGRSHYLKPHLASRRFVSILCCLSFPECLACVVEQQTAQRPAAASAAPSLTESVAGPLRK